MANNDSTPQDTFDKMADEGLPYITGVGTVVIGSALMVPFGSVGYSLVGGALLGLAATKLMYNKPSTPATARYVAAVIASTSVASLGGGSWTRPVEQVNVHSSGAMEIQHHNRRELLAPRSPGDSVYIPLDKLIEERSAQVADSINQLYAPKP